MGIDNKRRLTEKLDDACDIKQNFGHATFGKLSLPGIIHQQVPQNLIKLVDWIEAQLAYDSRAAMLRQCYKEQQTEISFEEIRARSYHPKKIKWQHNVIGELARLRIEHPRTLPLSPQLIQYILSSLSTPLTAYAGYHTYREQSAPCERIKSKIQLDNTIYTVVGKLGEGGMGKVYRIEQSLQSYALKIETPPNAWEFYIMRQLEARLVPHCTHAYSIHHYENASFLIMDMKEGMTLLQALNVYREKLSQQQMPEMLVIHITAQLLNIIAALHDAKIVHGDLKMDNVMIQACNNGEIGLTLIDFGRSIDLSVLPNPLYLKAGWRLDATDHLFLSQEKAWPSWKIDYWGVADTAHWLLYGTAMSTRMISNGRYTITKQLKRYWQKDLWNRFFELLLNPPDKMQSAMPIQELAKEFEKRSNIAAAKLLALQLESANCREGRQRELARKKVLKPK